MRRPAALCPALVVLLSSALLGACASSGRSADRIDFTEQLVADYQLDVGKRQRLQYYLSDDVKLLRAVGSGSSEVTRGKLISRAGSLYEEIDIAAGTPGVAVASGQGWVAVSFVPNGFLYFVSDYGGNAGMGSRAPEQFYLYSRDFDGKEGTVIVDGTPYRARHASLDAHLLIDREDYNRSASRSSRMPGRWLSGPLYQAR